jgi:hypothetical protein
MITVRPRVGWVSAASPTIATNRERSASKYTHSKASSTWNEDDGAIDCPTVAPSGTWRAFLRHQLPSAPKRSTNRMPFKAARRSTVRGRPSRQGGQNTATDLPIGIPRVPCIMSPVAPIRRAGGFGQRHDDLITARNLTRSTTRGNQGTAFGSGSERPSDNRYDHHPNICLQGPCVAYTGVKLLQDSYSLLGRRTQRNRKTTRFNPCHRCQDSPNLSKIDRQTFTLIDRWTTPYPRIIWRQPHQPTWG